MSDSLSNTLRNVKHADLSAETMELMGKQASNLLLEKGISLNESIAKLAAAHADINQEQIKRVCEYANTATYLAKHDTAKTAGSRVSYPEFDLADPNRVIQDLSDGAKPTVITKVDSDYSKMPERKAKTSAARGDAMLEELFQVKTASADLDFSRDTAVNEVMSSKEQLVGLRNHLRHSAENLDLTKKAAAAEFYDLAKRHVLDGGSMADIYKAVDATGASAEKIASVLSPVVAGFLREKVASAAEMKSALHAKEKLAHRLINPEHPMVKAAGTIIDCNEQIDVVAGGLSDVSAQLRAVDSFIRETFHAGKAS